VYVNRERGTSGCGELSTKLRKDTFYPAQRTGILALPGRGTWSSVAGTWWSGPQNNV